MIHTKWIIIKNQIILELNTTMHILKISLNKKMKNQLILLKILQETLKCKTK